jgi:hypothetical protein
MILCCEPSDNEKNHRRFGSTLLAKHRVARQLGHWAQSVALSYHPRF